MRIRSLRFFLCVGSLATGGLALALPACGDDPPPPPATTPDGGDETDAPSSTDAPSLDDAGAATKCPEACEATRASATCAGKTYKDEPCQRFCGCITGAFRPEVVPGALACIAGCRDGGEDKCLAANVRSYETDPESKATVEACMERQAQCRDAGTSLGTDICAVYGTRPEFLRRLAGCFALPCVEARACVTAVYQAAGCSL